MASRTALARCVPLAVRTALGAGDRALAERLAGSIEPLQPLYRHAVTAAQALVMEARGEHEADDVGVADGRARSGLTVGRVPAAGGVVHVEQLDEGGGEKCGVGELQPDKPGPRGRFDIDVAPAAADGPRQEFSGARSIAVGAEARRRTPIALTVGVKAGVRVGDG